MLDTEPLTTSLVLRDMAPLFKRAELEGLWFYSAYLATWFTPEELKESHAQRRFLWGPCNWELRDPRDYVLAARVEADAAGDRARGVEQRYQSWRAGRAGIS